VFLIESAVPGLCAGCARAVRGLCALMNEHRSSLHHSLMNHCSDKMLHLTAILLSPALSWLSQALRRTTHIRLAERELEVFAQLIADLHDSDAGMLGCWDAGMLGM
jgi:hypothetical protein